MLQVPEGEVLRTTFVWNCLCLCFSPWACLIYVWNLKLDLSPHFSEAHGLLALTGKYRTSPAELPHDDARRTVQCAGHQRQQQGPLDQRKRPGLTCEHALTNHVHQTLTGYDFKTRARGERPAHKLFLSRIACVTRVTTWNKKLKASD